MLIRFSRLVRHELARLRSLWLPLSLCFAAPLAMLALQGDRWRLFGRAGESEQLLAEPLFAAGGLATVAGIVALASVGSSFLSDCEHRTWHRVRALGVTATELLSAKLVAACLIELAIFSLLAATALLLRDASRSQPSPVVFIVVVGAASAVSVSYCLVACSTCRSQAGFSALIYSGALLAAGLGGAIVPGSALPEWAQVLAHAVPTYWSTRAFEAVVVGGAGLIDVWIELAVLFGFCTLFTVVGCVTFDESRARSTTV